MNLQGRELSVRMKGEDVQLLQRELRCLDFDIPDREADKCFFGKGTREVVR